MAVPKAMKPAMKRVVAMKTKAMRPAAKKAMKAMKVKKTSIVARGTRAKSLVLSGRRKKTVGGMTSADLTKNAAGRIVSKKSRAHGKRAYANIKCWTLATQRARKALGLNGFVPVGGKTAQGMAFYKKAKAIFASM